MSETSVSTTTLRWAVRVLFVHAAAVGVLAIFVIYAAVTTKGASTVSVVATPLITIFFAAMFGLVAFSLHRFRAWARGPAIVLELLLIPIGLGAVSGIPAIGLLLAATGLLGAGLLLAPSTRTALGLTNSASN